MFFSLGGPDASLSRQDLFDTIDRLLTEVGDRNKMLLLPPDGTRRDSRAGEITSIAYERWGSKIVDIMPALGTHFPMTEPALASMFPNVPYELFREHDWRNDVVTLGVIDSDFVKQTTEGAYDRPWSAQVNRLLRDGGHDLILSIGQVVPHEVIGMANYNKNVFVGTGGYEGINESHYLSAVYGIERTLGVADTPLRRILNEAQDRFCKDMPLVYLLTVIGTEPDGTLHTRGIFAGDNHDVFFAAAELARQVNITHIDRAPQHVVTYLDPEEFHSTWLGNKSIYRTRKAIADGGRLTVIGPAVGTFGEDPQIDALIRRYGYQGREDVMRLVNNEPDLAANLSAAAHLVHGCPEGRFEVVYGAGKLSFDEIKSAGFTPADVNDLLSRYDIHSLSEGWNQDQDGSEFYYVRNPALGLWESPAVEG